MLKNRSTKIPTSNSSAKTANPLDLTHKYAQVARTIDLVRTKYLKAAITYQGIQRIERYPVPDAALREAVLNALVHRDYAIGAPVQIRVYEDRLSIWNPAVLPEGWTVKNLLRDHPSTPFNPAVANVFFRSGEIETWGRGIERILAACKNADTPKPSFTFDGTGITLEFRFAPDYLKAFAVTDPVTADDETGLESGLESIFHRTLQVLATETLSKSQIATAIGQQTASGKLHERIRQLLNLALIERTLPDKPNSRLQKYRLTAKGRRIIMKDEL